jgi:hypothetical protein
LAKFLKQHLFEECFGVTSIHRMGNLLDNRWRCERSDQKMVLQAAKGYDNKILSKQVGYFRTIINNNNNNNSI